MSVQQPPSGHIPAASLHRPGGPARWDWQRLARRMWAVLAFGLLASFVANLPTFVQLSQSVCSMPNPGDCPTGKLTPAYVHTLHQLHLSVALAGGVLAALTLGVSVAYWAMGLLIFWRKSHEWIGLLTSLLLVMLGAVGIDGFLNLPVLPLLHLVTDLINVATGLGFVLFVFVFPTGRFTPRWTRVVFALSVPLLLLPSSIVPAAAGGLTYLVMIAVQVYRYRRVYDLAQRQQTKWFVFGMSLVIALLLIEGLIGIVAPNSLWYQVANGPLWLLIWTILLLSVSLPILCYGLWDIDLLINRTLVYASLTGVLAGIYLGSVLGLQALFRAITGQQSDLAVALSTLMIAILFNPLRHRVQELIARAFYRRKYDAVHVLSAFGSSCRDETDLEQLRSGLLWVVNETMHPTHVSLWLRD